MTDDIEARLREVASIPDVGEEELSYLTYGEARQIYSLIHNLRMEVRELWVENERLETVNDAIEPVFRAAQVVIDADNEYDACRVGMQTTGGQNLLEQKRTAKKRTEALAAYWLLIKKEKEKDLEK
jgi:hypothetical protein